MKIYLFDTKDLHENLRPLSFTRPVAEFRLGILTLKEKWERTFPGDYHCYPVEYLRKKFGTVENPEEEALFIVSNLLPEKELCEAIHLLSDGEAILDNDEAVVFKGSLSSLEKKNWRDTRFKGKLKRINYIFDLFLYNYEEIERDYKLVTEGRKSAPLPSCTRRVSPLDDDSDEERIFIEEEAEIECATINVKNGPVYIGKGASIMEGACVRGPLAICEGAEVRMGAKIYGGTTIGPYCKVGGEIDNTVMFGYSNKAHDGYLGNAVIGEWCNIGAGVNASNLKNDYSMIRVWNYRQKRFMKTDLQFCGLIMGDHSKIGVNCMVNTATVIGVGVNLHGSGFPRVYLSNFSEGSPSAGFSSVGKKKFLEIAERVMSRRSIELDDLDIDLFNEIYSLEE